MVSVFSISVLQSLGDLFNGLSECEALDTHSGFRKAESEGIDLRPANTYKVCAQLTSDTPEQPVQKSTQGLRDEPPSESQERALSCRARRSEERCCISGSKEGQQLPEVLRPGRTLEAPQANRGSLADESEILPFSFPRIPALVLCL